MPGDAVGVIWQSPRWALQPYPARVSLPVAVTARVWLTASGVWQVQFALRGDLTNVVMPAPATPVATDGLWQHTCCELFIGRADSAAYAEVNMAPSGQWATYHFSDYRQRDAARDHQWQPRIRCRQRQQCVLVRATLPPLPEPVTPVAAWDIGLAAVVVTADGTLHYWALQHPSAQPDFHHRAGWRRCVGSAEDAA